MNRNSNTQLTPAQQIASAIARHREIFGSGANDKDAFRSILKLRLKMVKTNMGMTSNFVKSSSIQILEDLIMDTADMDAVEIMEHVIVMSRPMYFPQGEVAYFAEQLLDALELTSGHYEKVFA